MLAITGTSISHVGRVEAPMADDTAEPALKSAVKRSIDLEIYGTASDFVAVTNGEGSSRQANEEKSADEERAVPTVGPTNYPGEQSRTSMSKANAVLLVVTLCGAAFLNVRYVCHK